MNIRRLNLRNVAVGIACLAVLGMFFSCKKEETHKKHLNGLWKVHDGWCVEIKKDKGYFVLLEANDFGDIGLSRFLTIGDLALKDLKKEGENRWSGKSVFWWYNTNTGEVLELDWGGATFVLSEDKKSMIEINEFGRTTYYKVNNVLDRVPDQPILRNLKQQQEENTDSIQKMTLSKLKAKKYW